MQIRKNNPPFGATNQPMQGYDNSPKPLSLVGIRQLEDLRYRATSLGALPSLPHRALLSSRVPVPAPAPSLLVFVSRRQHCPDRSLHCSPTVACLDPRPSLTFRVSSAPSQCSTRRRRLRDDSQVCHVGSVIVTTVFNRKTDCLVVRHSPLISTPRLDSKQSGSSSPTASSPHLYLVSLHDPGISSLFLRLETNIASDGTKPPTTTPAETPLFRHGSRDNQVSQVLYILVSSYVPKTGC